MTHPATAAAVRRDYAVGFHVDAICEIRGLDAATVRSILFPRKPRPAIERTAFGEGYVGVARGLIKNGHSVEVVHANFCDWITLEEAKEWEANAKKRKEHN